MSEIIELSHYVQKTNNVLVNLTTKEVLPQDGVSTDELRSKYFLAGQEHDAIQHALFGNKRPENMSMKITPTWRCNLRCKHCFVLDKLTSKQTSHLDVSQLMQFIEGYVNHFDGSVKTILCCLVGGEVTLEVDKCLEITERIIAFCKERGIDHFFSMTTNGTVLNRDVLELMNRCGAVTVSVDGVPELHNAQRKAASDDLKGKNLYEISLGNIRKLVKLGLQDKLGVQAALEDCASRDMLREFFTDLVRAGVKPKRIKIGAVAPTKHNPEVNDSFKEYMATNITGDPCCNWRMGREFVIDNSNTVYCDYYRTSGVSVLGKLTDPVQTILDNHRRLIESEMTVLHDEKCLSCPVIGACWGRCCYVLKAHKPSEICDQAGLIETVKKKAESGELLELLNIDKR